MRERLALELREECTVVAPVSQGIAFLGFRVFPGLLRLQRAGWTRFKHKVRAGERAYREGDIDEHTLVQSVQSLLGHVRHGDTYWLRRGFFGSRPLLG